MKAVVHDRDDLFARVDDRLLSVRVDHPAGTVQRPAANDVHVKAIPGPGVDFVSGLLHAFNTIHDVDQLLAAL